MFVKAGDICRCFTKAFDTQVRCAKLGHTHLAKYWRSELCWIQHLRYGDLVVIDFVNSTYW